VALTVAMSDAVIAVECHQTQYCGSRYCINAGRELDKLSVQFYKQGAICMSALNGASRSGPQSIAKACSKCRRYHDLAWEISSWDERNGSRCRPPDLRQQLREGVVGIEHDLKTLCGY
jgi:hypothetical protein